MDKIDPLTYTGTTKKELDRLCDAYRTKVYLLADSKAVNMMSNIMKPNSDNIKEAERDEKNLQLVKKYIDDGTIDLNDADDIKDVCDKLNVGYNTVKKNRDFVNFASEADKKAYTADNSVTKVKRMVSVFDVWQDFVQGRFEGHGFLFWIIISVLVDMAAFIFFDLAFKKSDY